MADVEDALPRGVALTWGVAENPQRGPRRELSIERIVETAVEIADAEGLGAVSMSRVATALGFTTMSLYRYVTSKDDLLVLMGDAASEVPIPPDTGGDDWRGGVSRWAVAARAAYRAHPWMVDLPINGAPMTPNTLLMADWMLRELAPLPLDDDEKMATLLLLSSYVRATAAIERDISALISAGTSADSRRQSEALATLVTPERFPSLSPLVAAGLYDRDDDNTFDDFAFGLGRILDGIDLHTRDVEKRPDAPVEQYEIPRDKAVREAAKARREAEGRVREALKREREAIKRARERAERG